MMDEIEKEEKFRNKIDTLALGIRNSSGVAAENILKWFAKKSKYFPDDKDNTEYTTFIMPELMIYSIFYFHKFSFESSKNRGFIKTALIGKAPSESQIDVVCYFLKMRIMDKYVPKKFANKFEKIFESKTTLYKKSKNFRKDSIDLIKSRFEKIFKNIDPWDMLYVMHCIDQCALEVITGDYKKYK